eukprot:XP_001701371.1 predicted protein [Chlamydomonas reinhardtii]
MADAENTTKAPPRAPEKSKPAKNRTSELMRPDPVPQGAGASAVSGQRYKTSTPQAPRPALPVFAATAAPAKPGPGGPTAGTPARKAPSTAAATTATPSRWGPLPTPTPMPLEPGRAAAAVVAMSPEARQQAVAAGTVGVLATRAAVLALSETAAARALALSKALRAEPKEPSQPSQPARAALPAPAPERHRPLRAMQGSLRPSWQHQHPQHPRPPGDPLGAAWPPPQLGVQVQPAAAPEAGPAAHVSYEAVCAGVRYWLGGQGVEELRPPLEPPPSLQRLRQLDRRVGATMEAYCAARCVVTLWELERHVCASEGVEAFGELRLGPLTAHPVVRRTFFAGLVKGGRRRRLFTGAEAGPPADYGFPPLSAFDVAAALRRVAAARGLAWCRAAASGNVASSQPHTALVAAVLEELDRGLRALAVHEERIAAHLSRYPAEVRATALALRLGVLVCDLQLYVEVAVAALREEQWGALRGAVARPAEEAKAKLPKHKRQALKAVEVQAAQARRLSWSDPALPRLPPTPPAPELLVRQGHQLKSAITRSAVLCALRREPPLPPSLPAGGYGFLQRLLEDFPHSVARGKQPHPLYMAWLGSVLRNLEELPGGGPDPGKYPVAPPEWDGGSFLAVANSVCVRRELMRVFPDLTSPDFTAHDLAAAALVTGADSRRLGRTGQLAPIKYGRVTTRVNAVLTGRWGEELVYRDIRRQLQVVSYIEVKASTSLSKKQFEIGAGQLLRAAQELGPRWELALVRGARGPCPNIVRIPHALRALRQRRIQLFVGLAGAEE